MPDLKSISWKYEEINPISMIFPSNIAVIIYEKNWPHVPKTAVIQKATQGMTVEEKRVIRARAENMMAIAKVVIDAVSAEKQTD